jgi:predicted metal-dependent peptidase
VLREFITRTARADYSWARPARRFVAAGLYLPGLASDELGEVLVGIDVSGSVDAATLAAFEGELNAVLSAHPFRCARVVFCDAKVHRVDTVTPQDLPVRLTPVGGGGTDHDPLFAHVAAEGWEVSVAVLLTDGHTRVTCPPPSFDVLWAISPGGNTALPFGRVVRLG